MINIRRTINITTGTIYIINSKQDPYLTINLTAKGKWNIIMYGYSNNSVATIINGIVSKTTV